MYVKASLVILSTEREREREQRNRNLISFGRKRWMDGREKSPFSPPRSSSYIFFDVLKERENLISHVVLTLFAVTFPTFVLIVQGEHSRVPLKKQTQRDRLKGWERLCLCVSVCACATFKVDPNRTFQGRKRVWEGKRKERKVSEILRISFFLTLATSNPPPATRRPPSPIP